MEPMTIRGEEKLREELEGRKMKDRPRMIRAVANAREHGDYRENAEYKTAQEEQSLVEARIRTIEARLSQKRIIDITTISPNNRVIFGTTVTLLKKDDKQQLCYQIVGEDEADVKQNKISYSSPLAKALIGKEARTEVELDIPAGKVSYLIEKIEHI